MRGELPPGRLLLLVESPPTRGLVVRDAERLLGPALGMRARLPVRLRVPYVPSPGRVPLDAFGLREEGAGALELLDPLWTLGTLGETGLRARDEELGLRFVAAPGDPVEARGNW